MEDFLHAEHARSLQAQQHVTKFNTALASVQESNHNIEINSDLLANVDIKAFYSHGIDEEDILSWDDLPLTILTEVCNVYPHSQTRERGVLINAGTSSLGQKGTIVDGSFGLLSQWNIDQPIPMRGNIGWQVVRAESEYSVLCWKGADHGFQPLEYGQRVRIYPWDAQEASRGFGWYLVIDSSLVGREDEILDVFVRWRD